MAAFRKGLNETGYVEDENVTVEYHWVEGQSDRLSTLVADLVHRGVAVIATPGTRWLRSRPKLQQQRSRLSSASPKTRLRLVLSLVSPGPAAMRLASSFSAGRSSAKRLRLLHDFAPNAVRVAVLVNPADARTTDTTLREVQEAAPTIGLQIQVFDAATISEIDAVFVTLARERPETSSLQPMPSSVAAASQLANLTARGRIPAIYCDA